MVPCTPPEFLKLASFPPTPPAQRRCICATMGSAVSFHYWCKNHNGLGLPHLVKSQCIEVVFLQLVPHPSMLLQMTGLEEDTPLWRVCSSDQLWEKAVDCRRIGGTRQILRVWSHVRFVSFGSVVWKFVTDKTIHSGDKVKEDPLSPTAITFNVEISSILINPIWWKHWKPYQT